MVDDPQYTNYVVCSSYFVLCIIYLILFRKFQVAGRENKEERDKEKTAEQKKDEALQTLGLSITRSLMLYVADKETFFWCLESRDDE